MPFLFQNDRVLSAVGKDDRMSRNKFFVVFKCPGGDTIKFQMPGPLDSSCIKYPGFAREGMLAAGIDSHITTVSFIAISVKFFLRPPCSSLMPNPVFTRFILSENL